MDWANGAGRAGGEGSCHPGGAQRCHQSGHHESLQVQGNTMPPRQVQQHVGRLRIPCRRKRPPSSGCRMRQRRRPFCKVRDRPNLVPHGGAVSRPPECCSPTIQSGHRSPPSTLIDEEEESGDDDEGAAQVQHLQRGGAQLAHMPSQVFCESDSPSQGVTDEHGRRCRVRRRQVRSGRSRA